MFHNAMLSSGRACTRLQRLQHPLERMVVHQAAFCTAPLPTKVNLNRAFAKFSDQWSPKVRRDAIGRTDARATPHVHFDCVSDRAVHTQLRPVSPLGLLHRTYPAGASNSPHVFSSRSALSVLWCIMYYMRDRLLGKLMTCTSSLSKFRATLCGITTIMKTSCS